MDVAFWLNILKTHSFSLLVLEFPDEMNIVETRRGKTHSAVLLPWFESRGYSWFEFMTSHEMYISGSCHRVGMSLADDTVLASWSWACARIDDETWFRFQSGFCFVSPSLESIADVDASNLSVGNNDSLCSSKPLAFVRRYLLNQDCRPQFAQKSRGLTRFPRTLKHP